MIEYPNNIINDLRSEYVNMLNMISDLTLKGSPDFPAPSSIDVETRQDYEKSVSFEWYWDVKCNLIIEIYGHGCLYYSLYVSGNDNLSENGKMPLTDSLIKIEISKLVKKYIEAWKWRVENAKEQKED